MMEPPRTAALMSVNRAEKKRVIQGRFFRRLRRSAQNAPFWSAGGATRSRVFAKVKRNIATETTEKISMVYRIPSASLPPPSAFFSGTTSCTMRNWPTNAQMNRNDESEVRSSDEGDITPIRAEYGMLIAV